MAGKLPSRKLCVVTRDVWPRAEDWDAGLNGADFVPLGTICQLLATRDRMGRWAQALIYYERTDMRRLVRVWVPQRSLRPYDPEKDAPKEEARDADELPPRGPCT